MVKDHPHGGEKKKKEDGRRGKITFRIKPHTHQRHSEGSKEILVHMRIQRPYRD